MGWYKDKRLECLEAEIRGLESRFKALRANLLNNDTKANRRNIKLNETRIIEVVKRIDLFKPKNYE